MLRYVAIAAACLVLGVLGATAWLVLGRGDDRYADCRASSVAGGAAAIGGPFTLTRQDGVEVTDKDVIQGPTLIYFGYTFCPDVCPLDMTRNGEVVGLLAARGIDLGLAMITVDPARDTPEVMGDYVGWMHPDAVGLTGTEAQVEAAKSAYRVYSARAGSDPDYAVDHTTYTYLMAPGEGLLDFFRRDETADAMADRVACFAGRL